MSTTHRRSLPVRRKENEMTTDNKAKEDCITLIGMPGCGKSSWVKGYNQNFSIDIMSIDKAVAYLSSNENSFDVEPMLNRTRNTIGATNYQENFNTHKDNANVYLHGKMVGWHIHKHKEPTNNETVVIDSTNLTKAKRAFIRESFPSTYWDHYAVFFPCESFEKVLQINSERETRGRSIMPDILKDMYEVYETEAKDFVTSEEAKLYKKVWVPEFQNILHFGKIYD